MNSLSTGTVLTLLIASASGTNFDVWWNKGHHHPILAGFRARTAPAP